MAITRVRDECEARGSECYVVDEGDSDIARTVIHTADQWLTARATSHPAG